MTEPNETPIDASWEEMVAARNRPRTPQHALLMAVRAGEMTPKQADGKCLADGLPVLHEGWQDLHDITTNSVWSIPLAILFYSWQDLRKTREEAARFTVWKDQMWRDPTDELQIRSLAEAEAMLRQDLWTGLVRAFGQGRDAVLRPIPYEDWSNLIFSHKKDFSAVDETSETIYGGVFVLRHEIVPLLISEHAASTATAAIEPEMRARLGEQPPKRGRKPEPEVDRFWIEVHKATLSAKYGSQKLLTEHMVQWASNGQCSYDPETIRKKVSALYREMDWRGGAAD